MGKNEQKIDVTKQAYEYAKSVKKVNEGVIEAFKEAYNRGHRHAQMLPDRELLELIKSRYRSKFQVQRDLGMSDARRGINREEGAEIEKHELVKSFIEKLDKID